MLPCVKYIILIPVAMTGTSSLTSGRAIGAVRGYLVPRPLLDKAVRTDPSNLIMISRLLGARVDSAFAYLRSHNVPRNRAARSKGKAG